MTLEAKLQLVSANCLHGKPVPHALRVLWQADENNDAFVKGALWLNLLTSHGELDEIFSENAADGDEGIIANTRAHRRVFERLGFFAQGDDGEFYAFDLQTGAPEDPPVVVLDTEGQYDWKGENLAEFIFRIAEDRDKGDDARSWLREHDLQLGELGELGSTTQFFPSIQKYQEGIYYECLGEPQVENPTPSEPVNVGDMLTWLLRPGPEVRAAICEVLKLPAGSRPTMYCAWCDGAGRVTNVKLPRTDATKDHAMCGVRFGMSEDEVKSLLGESAETGKKNRVEGISI